MRSMLDDGLSITEIAGYFQYPPAAIETLIDWHKKLYPTMPPYDGDTDLWKAVKSVFIPKARE